MDSLLSGQEVHASPDTRTITKPVFQRISDHIWSEISSPESNEHTPIPSEREVAVRYGVSRMTARRALEALELKGLVYSAGRKGRFISPKRFTYDISRGYEFFLDARARGVEFDIVVLERKESKAGDWVAQKLQVPVAEPITQYTRLFKSGGHAVFIETEFIIAKRFPRFLENDLSQSTTRLFETEYNTFGHTGDMVIRMRSLNNQEATWLGVADNQSSIELQQVISDESGTPFCFGNLLWRGELTEFTARTVVRRNATTA